MSSNGKKPRRQRKRKKTVTVERPICTVRCALRVTAVTKTGRTQNIPRKRLRCYMIDIRIRRGQRQRRIGSSSRGRPFAENDRLEGLAASRQNLLLCLIEQDKRPFGGQRHVTPLMHAHPGIFNCAGAFGFKCVAVTRLVRIETLYQIRKSIRAQTF